MRILELDALKKIIEELRGRLWGGSPQGRMSPPHGWLLPAATFLRPVLVRAEAPVGVGGARSRKGE